MALVGKKRPRRILMPIDFMCKVERKIYTKASEVKLSNMYKDLHNVPSHEEIDTMEHDVAKSIIDATRQFHTNAELMQHWGFHSSSSLHGFFRKHDAMLKRGGWRKGAGRKGKPTQQTKTHADNVPQAPTDLKHMSDIFDQMQNQIKLLNDHIIQLENANKKDDCGFKITLKDVMDSKETEEKLQGILLSLSEDTLYEVSLVIQDIAPLNEETQK